MDLTEYNTTKVVQNRDVSLCSIATVVLMLPVLPRTVNAQKPVHLHANSDAPLI